MLEQTYKPSMPIVRELARARLGEPAHEEIARQTCIRRGLVTWRGNLTDRGVEVLSKVGRQFSEYEARAFNGRDAGWARDYVAGGRYAR